MKPITRILKSKTPRLLIVGGSGRLGRLLRRAWSGHSALGEEAPLCVWQARREGAFASEGGASLLFDPLAEPEAYAAAARSADVVLSLSGVTRGTEAELAVNTPLALAALAAAAGKPVLIASSAAVYGRTEGLLSETVVPAPVAPYGVAKAQMEQAVAGAGAPGAVILRIGNVAGADALLGAAAPEGGRRLDVFADGHGPRRSFIGPEALARALGRLVRIAAAGAELPPVLNLALPGAVAMDALLDAAGARWTPRPAPGGTIPCVELDVSRAVSLGLVPETEARAGEIVADWHRTLGEVAQ